MRLILIRHGESTANVGGVLDTLVPGPLLTELGKQQATKLADTFADEPIEAIFVSTMIRTHLTARPLANKLNLTPLERAGIREIGAGDLEGATDHESAMKYVGTFVEWVAGNYDARMPGGESGRETLGRFDEVVLEAESLGLETVAFVAHGAIIRAWLGTHTQELDINFLKRNYVENTGYAIVSGSTEEGWKLEAWRGGGVFDAPPVFEGNVDPVEATVED